MIHVVIKKNHLHNIFLNLKIHMTFEQPYFLFIFQHCDIAVNWSGGLHHAKKYEVRNNVSVVTIGITTM